MCKNIFHIYKTEVLFSMDIRKEKITKEQLIGVVCRSVVAFLLMLTIIILIIQKKRRLNEVYDENLFLSVESEN